MRALWAVSMSPGSGRPSSADASNGGHHLCAIERPATGGNLRHQDPRTAGLSVGYFGASTGAAAALVAAAQYAHIVRAVVSRGGRPDLAGSALRVVQAPTLLLVGGDDEPVIGLNEEALAQLATPEKKLVIVPGASHLFEEPGKLEEVARLAADWFSRHLDLPGEATAD